MKGLAGRLIPFFMVRCKEDAGNFRDFSNLFADNGSSYIFGEQVLAETRIRY